MNEEIYLPKNWPMYNNFAICVDVYMFSLKKIMRDQIERDYIIIAFITWDQYF